MMIGGLGAKPAALLIAWNLSMSSRHLLHSFCMMKSMPKPSLAMISADSGLTELA